MSEKLKQDLKAIADGQGLHQVADPKQVAKDALKRIEDLEADKPKIQKDTLVTSK